MMTIAVYTIDSRTGERRTIQEKHAVEGVPVSWPDGTDETFPQCRCGRSPACARAESEVVL